MAILNYTTKVDPVKTINEITNCLVKHGAKKIMADYDDNGTPIAITFMINITDEAIFYSLPANFRGVLKAMEKDKTVPPRLRNELQAKRVAWRIVKDWIEAQMAIVEANIADMAEVFLPYAVTKSGNTLYNEIKSNPKLLQL
ncbi:hypothetical protein [Parapedobacter soli]|uniref:hypothetical protein n=1 Tax=Parapedobacter soli TaxID=416955 RepID=UPI0021C706C3|nr:hypothetical protein [Parapedobacter soli]